MKQCNIICFEGLLSGKPFSSFLSAPLSGRSHPSYFGIIFFLKYMLCSKAYYLVIRCHVRAAYFIFIVRLLWVCSVLLLVGSSIIFRGQV